MKQRLLAALGLSLLFTSCVWVPKGNTSKIRGKTSYKNFSELNDPIMLKLELTEDFTVLKNENLGSTTRDYGSLYLIYDWEKNQIFDYVYSPVYYYPENFTTIKDAAGNYTFMEYYDGRHMIVMSSDASELQIVKDFTDDTYAYGVAKNYSVINGKALLYHAVRNEPYATIDLYIYDSIKKEASKKARIVSCENDLDNDIVADPDGNYWLAISTHNSETYKYYTEIRKFDTKNDRLEEPFYVFEDTEGAVYDIYDGWSTIHKYDLCYADDSYLMLLKVYYVKKYIESSVSVVVLNKTTGEIKEIKLDTEDSSDVIQVNGKNLVFEQNNGTCYIHELDFDNLTSNKYKTDIENIYSSQIEVRGQRVYFIKRNDKDLKVSYYDTVSNEYKVAAVFTGKDFE